MVFLPWLPSATVASWRRRLYAIDGDHLVVGNASSLGIIFDPKTGEATGPHADRERSCRVRDGLASQTSKVREGHVLILGGMTRSC